MGPDGSALAAGSPPPGMVFTTSGKQRQCGQRLLPTTPSHLPCLQSCGSAPRNPSEHLHPNTSLFILPPPPRPRGVKPHGEAAFLLCSLMSSCTHQLRHSCIHLHTSSEGRGVISAQRGICDAKRCSAGALNGAFHLLSHKSQEREIRLPGRRSHGQAGVGWDAG